MGKSAKGQKDDDKDAKWIADLHKLGIVKGSFIPPKNFRILRELTRYKFKLTSVRSARRIAIKTPLLLETVN